MNTYTKLRDGKWGVRSTNLRIKKGYTGRVTVTKKDGDTEAHDVHCFWHGTSHKSPTGHVALCTIEDVDFPDQVPEGVRDRYGD